MLAVFLPPYPFRGVRAPYLWVFYRLLCSLKDKSLFITGTDYLLPPDQWLDQGRWELDGPTMANLGYVAPSQESFDKHDFKMLDGELFTRLLDSNRHNPMSAFNTFLTQSIPELEAELEAMLLSPRNSGIDAILSICNCPSLENVADKLSIPVIHIEVGPLRSPMYLGTGYVDFSGVNGNTEAYSRYLKVADDYQVQLTMPELHRFFSQVRLPEDKEAEFDFGLAMQVEDDSNIIAYSHGFNNLSMISYANTLCSDDRLLIRPHPGSRFQLKDGNVNVDDSPNSLEFLFRCKQILTINSSVGLEGLLLQKPVQVLGDSSYSFIADAKSESERANRMAFYLLSYLVPFDFIFDSEYLYFRLSKPAEIDIVNYHINYYLSETDALVGMNSMAMTVGELVSERIKRENNIRTEIFRVIDEQDQNINDKQQIIISLEEQLQQQKHQLQLQIEENITLQESLLHKDLTLKQAQAHTQQSQDKERELLVDELNRVISQKEEALHQQHADMLMMRKSLSWKLTMPVRMLGRAIRGEFCVMRDLTRHYFTHRSDNSSSLVSKIWYAFRNHPHPYNALGRKVKTALRLLATGNLSELTASLRRVAKNTADTPMPLTHIDTQHVVILASRHTLYVAHRVEKSLVDLGLGVTIVHAYSAVADSGQMHIVICPQMFPELPKNYVAFQMEQSINPRWFTAEYFSILNNAIAVFDYSLTNIEYLLQQGIPYQKLFYMPISSYDNYADHLSHTGYNLQPAQDEKDIDVLFYGDPNCERRQSYLRQLSKRFNVHIASEVFGQDLTRLVQRAKLIINIHYYEDALLETTRLYETLSLGTPIVSETSSDIQQHDILANVIDFAPVGDVNAMADKIAQLLADNNFYARRRQDIADFTRSDKQFDVYFKRYMLANDLIEFQQYKESADFIPHNETDIPKLCLSLTETPVRKQAFLSKPTYGFQIIEGVRHRIGWIGCGMSYKYMLSTLADRQTEMAMICEDDVLFPADFDIQLDKVVKHLRSTEWGWHVFAGIIAHLHEDTRVLAVKEIDGIEYVYINRMTSMVMNIYSRQGIELISQWDEKNIDSANNTIDRYLESAPGLTVVTTLPFMVGYAEDQHSTLWGFVNTQYTDMIRSSEQLLADKVKAFKEQQAKEVAV
uniref:GT99 family glycosyltransferase N-terminal domain-containing protein n=1 Tax=Serratia sp. (in: enterobacteria) TaxID=616 RepID=UPI003989FB7A